VLLVYLEVPHAAAWLPLGRLLGSSRLLLVLQAHGGRMAAALILGSFPLRPPAIDDQLGESHLLVTTDHVSPL